MKSAVEGTNPCQYFDLIVIRKKAPIAGYKLQVSIEREQKRIVATSDRFVCSAFTLKEGIWIYRIVSKRDS